MPKQTYTGTPNGIYPVLVNGVFYKEAYAKYQDGNTNLINDIFPDEFFQIRV